MKSGKITHYIEIPIEIEYTWYPEERMTQTYPGCHAHIQIDEIKVATEKEIAEALIKECDSINMACWENLEGE